MRKQKRREEIIKLLRTNPIASQTELVKALKGFGETVTQATVSRDLAVIGALKGSDGYYLPEMAFIPSYRDSSEMEMTVRRHVVSVHTADALVVIRTAPGHAGLLGVALDRWPPVGVEGIIAGDDTLFIATDSRSIAAKVCKHILSILNTSEEAA